MVAVLAVAAAAAVGKAKAKAKAERPWQPGSSRRLAPLRPHSALTRLSISSSLDSLSRPHSASPRTARSLTVDITLAPLRLCTAAAEQGLLLGQQSLGVQWAQLSRALLFGFTCVTNSA